MSGSLKQQSLGYIAVPPNATCVLARFQADRSNKQGLSCYDYCMVPMSPSLLPCVHTYLDIECHHVSLAGQHVMCHALHAVLVCKGC